MDAVARFTPRPLKLGYMTHAISAGSAKATYDELLELFVAADELGIDCGFIAQHHWAGPHAGQLPSPLVFLAAVATHTKRIHLGTAASVLPIEDPVRLAEDVAVLDALSGGRVELGVGTGGANLARYAAFGKDPADASRLHFEHLEILLSVLAGESRGGVDGSLTPATPTIAPRVWGAHGSESSARLAARHGVGLMFGTADLDARSVQRPLIEAYLDEWDAHGAELAPEPFRDQVYPRLGAIRMVFPSTSREAAKRESAKVFQAQAFRVAAARGVSVDDLTLDDVIEGLNSHIGHPEEIVESLLKDPALLGFVECFIPVLSGVASDELPGTRLDQTLRSLETIATQIAPELGWEPTHVRAARAAEEAQHVA
jgi:alkanesulfonate monooxygenase SsuD/methylene tetrahydromethanopterin reductase-like flavin-dependent oxidoreductase (luciferase family)